MARELRFYRKPKGHKYETKANNTTGKHGRISSVYLTEKLWDKLNTLTETTGASRNALLYMAVCDFLLNDNAYITNVFKDEEALKFLKQQFTSYVK